MLFLFKLILLMYNVFCMILPTMNFFQVCEMRATVCYVCVVHIVWTQDWWRPIYHFSFSWGYALYKKPIFLADLFPMCLRCFFQTEFSLSFSCLISWLLIIKFSNRRGILSVLIGFGIKKVLGFFDVQRFIYFSQYLTISQCIFLWVYKRFTSPANNLDLEELKHFWDHCHMKEIGEVLIRVFYFIRNQASDVALKVSLIWEFSRSKVYIKIDITIKIDNNAQA